MPWSGNAALTASAEAHSLQSRPRKTSQRWCNPKSDTISLNIRACLGRDVALICGVADIQLVHEDGKGVHCAAHHSHRSQDQVSGLSLNLKSCHSAALTCMRGWLPHTARHTNPPYGWADLRASAVLLDAAASIICIDSILMLYTLVSTAIHATCTMSRYMGTLKGKRVSQQRRRLHQ